MVKTLDYNREAAGSKPSSGNNLVLCFLIDDGLYSAILCSLEQTH